MRHQFKLKPSFRKTGKKNLSIVLKWGHPPILSGYVNSAVYSFDLALVSSSGIAIPSSSKHTALFSTGRSAAGDLAGGFWSNLGQSLNREAVFSRVP